MDTAESLLSMQATRRRWIGLGALSVTALLAHVLAFSGLEWAWPQHQAAAPATAVQVRVVEVAPAPLMAEPVVPVIVPTPVVKAVVLRPRPAPVVARVAAPAAEPEVLASQPVTTPATLVVTAAPAPAPEPAADTIPHYRTQIPPAIMLRYVMQRGALRGSGDLSWRPAGERYELTLEGSVAGLTVLTQVSSGGFDAAGIAPLRFTDQRLRRGTKAANFQRGAGKITFSGPSSEFPLHEGEQDRLSWMIQLGAVVAAEPQLRGVGAKVVMHVVGANGDASVWAFDCVALESVTTGAGSVSALKFVREPREPYDTMVQVWIDPARHYLPVRATQKSGPSDEGFELRLQSVE